MPAVAIVGAAIGSSVIGGALATGVLSGLGAAAGIVGSAIGGAIGGGIGGGLGSVMMGGDFGDGFKSGALGGLASGAFSGFMGADFGAAGGMSEAAFNAADAASLAWAGPEAMAQNLAFTGMGAGEIASALGSNFGISSSEAAAMADKFVGQFSAPGVSSMTPQGEMWQEMGPSTDTPWGAQPDGLFGRGSNINPDGSLKSLMQGDNSSFQTFGVNQQAATSPVTSGGLEGLGSSATNGVGASTSPSTVSGGAPVSSSAIGDVQGGLKSFLGDVQSKLKGIVQQPGQSGQAGGLGSLYSPQGIMALSDTMAGYQQANELEALAKKANEPYKQYMNMLNNPQDYWGADVESAARKMAQTGRTGLIPALNTQMWQQHYKNLPNTMGAASQMANTNFGNLAAVSQVRRNAPMQLGRLFTPQLPTINYYGR